METSWMGNLSFGMVVGSHSWPFRSGASPHLSALGIDWFTWRGDGPFCRGKPMCLPQKRQSHRIAPTMAIFRSNDSPVVGQANGMVEYVPHKEAFLRGGYEATRCGSRRLAPAAGELLAEGAWEDVKTKAPSDLSDRALSSRRKAFAYLSNTMRRVCTKCPAFRRYR